MLNAATPQVETVVKKIKRTQGPKSSRREEECAEGDSCSGRESRHQKQAEATRLTIPCEVKAPLQ